MHKPLQQFSTSTAKQSKIPKLIFLDIVTTHKDQTAHVKHVLHRGCVFHPICILGVFFGGGGRVKGLVQGPFMSGAFITNSNYLSISWYLS